MQQIANSPLFSLPARPTSPSLGGNCAEILTRTDTPSLAAESTRALTITRRLHTAPAARKRMLDPRWVRRICDEGIRYPPGASRCTKAL